MGLGWFWDGNKGNDVMLRWSSDGNEGIDME